ncbi:Aste57867_7328 [Aphanomyces stellatus]|nr:hypothetical protein As57867_007302 [Aphanomyces stellatus]VFT84247.1 Aste57867_7328 [Aphanomyces stellatus]
MAVTQRYTSHDATLNSVLVWLVTATLSLASPVGHTFALDKQCALTLVDFQVVCTSGTLTIGHLDRLVTITCVVLGCHGLCFVVAKLLVPSPDHL